MEKRIYEFDGDNYEGMRIVHARGDESDYDLDQNRNELLLLAVDESQDYHLNDFDALVFDHVMIWSKSEEQKAEDDAKLPQTDSYVSVKPDRAQYVLITKEKFNYYFKACLRSELLGNPLGREKSIICEILTGPADD